MALVTGHLDVSTRQWETRAGMLGDRVGGRFKGSLIMTAFTAVPERLSGKLGFVDVRVTRNTGKILDAIHNYRRLKFVALRALDLEMMLFQWKSCVIMLRHTESSMFEVLLNSVTLVTIAPFGSIGKLAAVRISMAISAACEWERLCEVSPEVTGVAGDLGMFP